MDIVPGLGGLVPDWLAIVLVPFVAAMLVFARVWQIRDRRRQEVRRAERRSRSASRMPEG